MHLNLSEVVTLNINTIGSLDERNKYIETFTDYIRDTSQILMMIVKKDLRGIH